MKTFFIIRRDLVFFVEVSSCHVEYENENEKNQQHVRSFGNYETENVPFLIEKWFNCYAS